MAGQERAASDKARGETMPQDSAARWLLKFRDRIYGPYSFEAMSSYVREGRVVAQSLVAPEGTLPGADAWQPAAAIPALSILFQPGGVASAASKESLLPYSTEVATPPSRQAYGSGKNQIDRRRQPETSNFIIIMDIKARYTGQLEQAIMSLGPAYKIAPNVWCVNSNATAAGLLNDLSQHIGKSDSMFIVDATRDRTAWYNMGPEADAKIRRVWRRPF